MYFRHVTQGCLQTLVMEGGGELIRKLTFMYKKFKMGCNKVVYKK